MKILCVAGARPNFIKVAPLLRALRGNPRFQVLLVHTGQHYDDMLSRIFFEDLQIPRPDIELEVGSGSHAAQTAEIMRRFEPIIEREQPEAVLVTGDVNSTIACALVTSKFWLRHEFTWKWGLRRRPIVIHVEAGLRSFDDDMPEEINRRLTDTISDLLFVSDPAGMDNLRREGVPEERTFFVGNVMIDTLLAARTRALGSRVLEDLRLPDAYALLTLHRPSNVDDPGALGRLLVTLDELAAHLRFVFPVHPRTRARLASAGIELDPARWTVVDSLGYLDFLKLQTVARVVLTDSGGVQEETTVLGVPCVTLRKNTERPVTLTEGTNFCAGTDRERIVEGFHRALASPREGRIPRYWDGQAASRIAETLAATLIPEVS